MKILLSMLLCAPGIRALPVSGEAGLASRLDENVATTLRSYLTRPLYLAEDPPECRALRRILVRYAPTRESGVGEPHDSGDDAVTRSRDEARSLCAGLALELAGGASFEELAARYSEEPQGPRNGGILGTFAPGLLRPDIEGFLWAAKIGAISPVLEGPSGFEIVQRIERYAACRTILIRGQGEEARARARALLEEIRGGGDFEALAREHSEDVLSAARGGHHAIFERGDEDKLLKAAVFRAPVGEPFGPLEVPFGYLVVERVPTDTLDESLRQNNWVRARSILIAHKDVGGSRDLTERTLLEAHLLAADLHERLLGGESMEALARRHDDDLDGRERRGDLGWLYRPNPYMVSVLDPLFLAEPGQLLDPLPIKAGWLLVRRER